MMPLINVVFLLLVFVVLVGEVVETAPFAVDPPEVAPQTASGPATVYLGPDGRIAVGGRMFHRDDLAKAVAVLEDAPHGAVVLEADRSVDAATAIDFVRRLHRAGIRSIRLVTAAAR